MRRDLGLLEWGVAGSAMSGQPISGDVAVVALFPGGALAGVVDGLGHGPEAARAANEAARVLRRFASEPTERLVERAHEALRETRGAVMTLASFRAANDTMTWVGVGDVQARLIQADGSPDGAPSMVPSGGIVGFRLPALRPTPISLSPGDLVVLLSDGVRSDVMFPSDTSGSPEGIARQILTEGNKGIDDAVVLVIRYRGTTR